MKRQPFRIIPKRVDTKPEEISSGFFLLNAFFERNPITTLPFQGLNAYLVGLSQDPKVA